MSARFISVFALVAGFVLLLGAQSVLATGGSYGGKSSYGSYTGHEIYGGKYKSHKYSVKSSQCSHGSNSCGTASCGGGGQDDSGSDPAPAGCTTLDFEFDANGNSLSKGQVIDDEFAAWGITVSATGGANKAMVFDTAHPTGGDTDLRTPGSGAGNDSALGKVLIISEDGHSNDPDDNWGGGTITFDYDTPVSIDGVRILDIDSGETGGTVEAFDAAGNLIAWEWIDDKGNNSVQLVDLTASGVSRLEVNLISSGAVAEIVYCNDDSAPPPPPASCDSQTATVDGSFSEWDLGADEAAPMFKDGNPAETQFATLYLRQDYDNARVYALVLAEDGFSVKNYNPWNFIKVGDHYVVKADGSVSGSEFDWVYSGSTRIGYEASFSHDDAVIYDLFAQVKIISGGNHYKAQTGSIDLDATCDDNSEPPTADFVQDEDGLVCFQAENYSNKTSGNGQSWEIDDSSIADGANGDAMIVADAGQAFYNGGYAPTGTPRMDYSVDFRFGGTHYFWARVYGEGDSSANDSIHAGINANATPELSKIHVDPDNRWTWEKRAFDLGTAGIKDINVWMREDGTRVDEICISNDSSFNPGYDDTPTPPTGDSNATCAAANVDGNASEWTDEDYFGRMYQGGDEGSQYLSDLYVRYDNGVVYLMALAAEGLEARTYAPWNWVKLGANTVVNANSGDNGNAPDFKWINASNGAADGWEASFPADEGTYHDFVAQLKVDDAEGVHQKSRNASTTLVIDCSNPQPQLGSIGDTVYEDFNGNGAQDALEPGIEGVTVTLRDSAGNVIATDETDANGNYLFENRASDDYKVVVDGASAPINGWTNTGDPDGTTDGQSVLTLGEGENNLAQDFGYKPPFIGNVGDCDTECKGGVIELSLLNNGPDGDIVVTDKHDRVLFAGHVPTGTEFTFLGKEDHGKMGTWIYVDNGAGQTDIHTSCSQEIGAGAVFGDFEVVYSISKDNGLVCPVTDPGPGGDCQECDGKVTHLTLRNDGPGAYITVQDKKNEVTLFEGQVANGGTFSVDGFDDKGTLGTEIKVYADGAETSIHTSCSVDIGPNAVFGNFVVVEGASRNGGELCPLPDPGPGPGPGDCQECDGKVTNLTLKNLGASAYIVVKNKKKTRILFEGQVASGGTFSLVGFDKKGTLGTEIKIYANGNETKIHTSCSVEIGPGSVFGDFLVVDGASRNGGQLCPIDGYNVCTAGDERVIDFELDSAGNAISLGDIITNQYAAQGVTVSAHGNPYDIAMVFDTANPTGGDNDLRTPGSGAGNDTALGNVLIISENGDSSNPDDEAEGGALIFDYANPIRVDALKVLDIEHGGSDIEAFDANGNSLGVIDIPGVGDNSVQTVQIGIDGVSRLVVNLTTSGAVGDLVYCGDAGNQPLVGSIGDRVWLDADADGNQDAGESGIAGVTVELLDGNGSVIDTDTTDANGEYLFTGLVADNYTLRVSGSPLSGLEQTFDDDGIASADQSTYALGAGENERDQDFGYTEPVLGCATPQAIDFETDAAGNPLGAGARITTQYASAGVIVGAVNPHKTHNVAMVFDSSNPTGGDNDLRTPGSGIGNNSALGNILIISEDNDASDPDDEARGGQIYFDYASPVRVDELVIVDIDSTSNGGFVEVFDANGASLGTVAIVPLGDNSVQTVTVGIENVSRLEVNFVSSAAVGEVVYCGEPGTANVGSIGDRVWLDLDRDGVQDGGAEVGINGVTVELLNAGGSVIATDTTSGDGQYLFEGLAAGTYTVRVSGAPLNGLLHTFDYDGGTAAPNQQSTYNLAQGEHERRQDFGFALGSIGDRVWLDLNADGVQDGNENGIEGVTVTLLDDQGSAPRTTTTDANGEYLFEGLRAGNYTVIVGGAPLAGLSQTFDDDGIATADTSSYSLAAGEHERDQDFGYVLYGSIGDRVWLDLNADGVQDANEPGIAGVTVELMVAGDVVATATTDANGEYLLEGLLADTYEIVVSGSPLDGLAQTYDFDGGLDAMSTYDLAEGEHDRQQDFGFTPGSIGDRVWLDLNADGVQDANEPGIAGVTVELMVAGDVVATATTDANGEYLFEGLLADTYEIVVSGSPLDGLAQTYDFDGGLDAISTYDLAEGENDRQQDFGFTLGSIGDRVWLDLNADGVQDGNENGIEGVTVTLLDDQGSAPRTTTTDANGEYLFEGLRAANYTVLVGGAALNGLAQTYDDDDGLGASDKMSVYALGAGEHERDQDFGFTLGSIGDRVWLDLNADGVQDGNENGIEGVTVTLLDDQGSAPRTTTTDANGEYLFEGLRAANYTVLVGGTALNGLAQTYDDDDGLGASDKMSVYALGAGERERDQDFGFTLGSIGDRVWLDLNADGVQDGNESGIEGVTVTLLDDQGSFPRTTTTDANGEYLFDGLVAGNYTVLVGGAPLNGLAQTYDYDDGLGASDKQSVYALSAGEHQRDQDFGFTLGSIGDTIFFDDNGNGVQDGAELGVEGVEVTVTGPNGFSETVTTDDSGFYEVTGLLAGDYTVTVSAGAGTPLEGYVNTADPDGTPDSTTVEDIAAGENDDVQDFGYRKSTNTLTASIGDRVWLDENSDGVQDAGEAGIANVLVQLFDENSVDPIAEDITDSDGGYLFTGLEPGVYFVSISDLPANLFGTFDEDDGVVGNPDDFVTPEEIEVDLEAGEHHRTADFGYNHATGDETKLPFDTDVGAIGDRVWYDTDGDGLQDAGEAGIPGVTLNLLVDNDADGVYETVLATQVTDEAGGYLFENLNPGAYVVEVVVSTVPAGYVQSGDPEGQSSLDNRTTNAVVIGPGDVWVNADFGYVPDTADTVAIGDTVYFDVDGDGVEDAEDYGIAGVTLKLLDSNDIVIATQVTDQNGNYLFDGLPAGEYTVVVNDTRNVLGNLVQSGDPEGNNDGRSTTTVPSGEDRLRDFGYTPAGHGPNDGLIGDTVFLDRDSNGEPGSDEGIAGVTVRLLNEDGALLAETQTDENGRYYFGGLDRNATYQVVVDETTLPEGVSQTVDPDATLDSRSTVDLSQDADGIDLDQDFGYEGLNRLEGTIWLDSDADGLLDGDENSRFNQITVVLRDENGNLVGVTRSDLEGNFSFDKLPDGTFSVDVTDDRNLLEGYWHSVVPASTADNESKQEPYAVTLGAGNRVDTTSDFGYFKRPAAIGNRVWFDLMDNGLQNDGEPGLAGALIELTVTYPSGAVVTAVVESQADGFYQFGGLLLDEDFDGVGAPGFDEPRFDLQVVADPVGYVPTLTIDVPGNDLLDSDDHAGVQAFTKQGADQVPLVVDAWETEADPNASYDFGYVVEIVQDPIARIEGRVYLDVNEDGDYDEGIDQPYEGVFIDITDLDTMELIPDEVVTGPDGTFGVDVAPGPYEIHVDDSDLPPDMTIDDFGDGMNPDNVTAVVDEVVRDNFGYIEPVLTCNEICDIDMTGGVSLDDYLDIDGVLQDTLVPIGAANSGDCVQDGRITGDDALACYFWINEPRRNP